LLTINKAVLFATACIWHCVHYIASFISD